jgi:hypothetical protein
MSLSGPSAQLPRSDEHSDEPSDDLLGSFCIATSFRRGSSRAFGRPSRVLLHSYLVRTSTDTSLQMTVSVSLQNSLVQTRIQTKDQTTFSGSSAQLPRSDEDPAEPLEDLLGSFFTTTFVWTSIETSLRTTFSVSLQNTLVRTRIQTKNQTTFSGSSAQLPRSNEDPDASDDLLGSCCPADSFELEFEQPFRRPSLVYLQNSLVRTNYQTPLQTSLQMTRLRPISANLCKLHFLFFFFFLACPLKGRGRGIFFFFFWFLTGFFSYVNSRVGGGGNFFFLFLFFVYFCFFFFLLTCPQG